MWCDTDVSEIRWESFLKIGRSEIPLCIFHFVRRTGRGLKTATHFRRRKEAYRKIQNSILAPSVVIFNVGLDTMDKTSKWSKQPGQLKAILVRIIRKLQITNADRVKINPLNDFVETEIDCIARVEGEER